MTSCTQPGRSGRGDQLFGQFTPQDWGDGTSRERSFQGIIVKTNRFKFLSINYIGVFFQFIVINNQLHE